MLVGMLRAFSFLFLLFVMVENCVLSLSVRFVRVWNKPVPDFTF